MLSETGGAMRIIVAGWEFTIGPMQAVVLGLILLVARLAGAEAAWACWAR